ncbi:hypothetical protein F3087_00655 [Nocardia colli]|uniref:Uncharacterized protein n=1 Tax=Nocardia colli TaxID=2545717 RepID=A0A5N0EPB2_9NOCA|nr:hypothetical protein [Nocardia colli]KAA8889875.1 hypothetical protein F3087_00655 [Nocardia colli]
MPQNFALKYLLVSIIRGGPVGIIQGVNGFGSDPAGGRSRSIGLGFAGDDEATMAGRKLIVSSANALSAAAERTAGWNPLPA